MELYTLANLGNTGDCTVSVCTGGCHGSGVGVTKAPLVNFSVSKIFDLAKVHVRFLESHSY